MTLKLTKEQKEARAKEYRHNYSRMYYQEQRDENSEIYKDILEKARLRYEKKQAENPDKVVKKYKKRNLINQNVEADNVVENNLNIEPV
jgi:hypothetical protein